MPKSRKGRRKNKPELVLNESRIASTGKLRTCRRTGSSKRDTSCDTASVPDVSDKRSHGHNESGMKQPLENRSPEGSEVNIRDAPIVKRSKRNCQLPARFRDSSTKNTNIDDSALCHGSVDACASGEKYSSKKTARSKQKTRKTPHRPKEQGLDTCETISEENNEDGMYSGKNNSSKEVAQKQVTTLNVAMKPKKQRTSLDKCDTFPEMSSPGSELEDVIAASGPSIETTTAASSGDAAAPKTFSSTTYPCSYCGKKCRNLTQVTLHERSHSGERPFPCADCGKRFSLKGNMLQHQVLHSEGKPFTCEICGQVFKTRSYCKQHLEIHQTSENYTCEFVGCKRSFTCRKNYLYHRMTHRQKKHACRLCVKRYHRKSQLIVHEMTHSKDRKFECPKCCKNCYNLGTYNKHMRTHKKKPHNCTKCRKYFATIDEKTKHEEMHKWYPFFDCEFCNRCGMSFAELSRHLKRHHIRGCGSLLRIHCTDCSLTFVSQNMHDQHKASFEIHCAHCNDSQSTACKWYLHRRKHKSDSSVQSGNKVSHVCDVCGKAFSTASICKGHMLTHGDFIYQCDICGKKSKTKTVHRVHMWTHSGEKTFCCEVCGKSFALKYNLNQHALIHSGVKPHKCEICQKAFRTRSLLKEHGVVHRTETPYQCDLCGKGYASRSNFKNHKNVHMNHRNFKCDVCGKRFFTSAVLRKHNQIHTGQHNYQCEYCGKKFIQHGNWLIHCRSHTGDKPHRCSRCPLGFVNSSQLKQHMKRVHDKNKTVMCDKCFKHFYDQKALRRHIQSMHVKKEGTRVYPCSKCGAVFTMEVNQCIHEISCTETKPSSQPSILQNVLKDVYSQFNESSPNSKLNVKYPVTTQPVALHKSEDILQLESIKKENKDNCENFITQVTFSKAISETESQTYLDGFQIVSPRETKPSDMARGGEVPETRLKVELVMEESRDVSEADGGPGDQWPAQFESQCHRCSDTFLTDLDLKQHQKLHKEELLYQCGRCQSRFGSADSLTQHLQDDCVKKQQQSTPGTSGKAGSSAVYVCDICQKPFSLRGHLRLHKESHRDWTRLKCNVCRREFRNRESFQDHHRSHSGKRFQCNVCRKGFTVENVLKLHIKYHHHHHHHQTKYTCLQCSECFTSIQDLKDHAKAHFRKSQTTSSPNHSTAPQLVHKSVQASIDVAVKGFGTTKAATKTTSKAVAELVHFPTKAAKLKTRSPKLQSLLTKSAPATSIVHPSFSILYTCGICDQRFSTQPDRDKHQVSHRTDVYVCSICDEKFLVQQDRDLHQASHRVDVLYVCSICDKKFSTSTDLDAHCVIHQEDVKFLCQICDLQFEEEQFFMEHIGVHGDVVMMVESAQGQSDQLQPENSGVPDEMV